MTSLCFLIILSASLVPTAAIVADLQYVMDQSNDCRFQGRIELPRGSTTYLNGRSVIGGTTTSCRLQFENQNTGDTLRVWFEGNAYIEDCDVSLSIELTDNPRQSFGCASIRPSSMGTLRAENGGIATITLRRKNLGDKSYDFKIAVRAQRSTDGGGASSSSSADAGLIAGIVVGVVVAIIICVVICVCCRRRRRENLARDRSGMALNPDTTKESLNQSIGFDNKAAQNGTMNRSPSDSPASDRRLIETKQTNALDRFGPSPSQRRRQQRSRGDYDDVESGRVRAGGNYGQEVRAQPARAYQETDFDQRQNDNGDSDYDRRRKDYEDRDYGQRRKPEVGARRGPLLEDLQNNPQFRKSFHQVEAKGESQSSGSLDSQGLPRPKLPPVPKSPSRSPSPQRRGEKIAGIFRDRPLSSSSDVARVEKESPTLERKIYDQEKKADTKHTLRPNRGEDRRPREEKRRNRRADSDVDSEDERRRERDRRDEERARRKRQEEEEEKEEELRRKREDKKNRDEERRRKEEEESDERRRRREDDKRDNEYEGRFKKSASGRKSKGKGTRMGRSRSTGNALEEMDANYKRSRSKSPSSVRSLNFVEEDDDDADSNYMPFRRAESKTSLYASRSSLYGRRRKNSMGETMSMSSYAYDDVDSRMGDFDHRRLNHGEKAKMFRSTGDLEMRPASAMIVRDVASQTGSERAVYVFGKKSLARERPGKRYSRGTQTVSGRDRRDSIGSNKSGRSTRSNRMKKRSKSKESLHREKRSRSRGYDDDYDSDRSRRRRARSKSRDKDYSDDELDDRRRRHRSKSRGISDDEDDRQSKSSRSKPKARPRRSQDLSDSEDDGKSGISSVAPSSVYPVSQQGYPPVVYPAGYPIPYPAGGVPYIQHAPGGPPMAVVAAPSNNRPPVAPKPSKSKWDQLVAMTDGEKNRLRHQGASVADTESVLGSVYGHPQQMVYAPPSYTTAEQMPDPNSTYSSAYPESSGVYPIAQSYNGKYADRRAPSDSVV